MLILISDLSFNTAGETQSWQERGRKVLGQVGRPPGQRASVWRSHSPPNRTLYYQIRQVPTSYSVFHMSQNIDNLKKWGKRVNKKWGRERLSGTNKKDGGQLFSILPGDKEFCPLICLRTLSYCTWNFLPGLGSFMYEAYLSHWTTSVWSPEPASFVSGSLISVVAALNRNPVCQKHESAGNGSGRDLNHIT